MFSQILNQEKAKRFLKQVMASHKIPHAYLFTGISGIGKTTTAMAFAMTLNCRDPNDGDGCGQCPSCRQMGSGNFPDFLSMKPEGQKVKIHQIRELNRMLSFAPVSGGYRVCVIEQAETMTEEAANALLKTLEEPPPGNILILNATEPLDLLPTIVSRCQRVPFQPLPAQEMSRWLMEKSELDEEMATVLARISAGSLGRALKMQESDFFQKRQDWLLKLMALPGLSTAKALVMAVQIAEVGGKKGLEVSGTGEAGITDMLHIWETWYRDLLVMRTGGPAHLLINVDFSHELKKSSRHITIQCLIDGLFAIDQAQQDLRRMRNPALVLEHTVLGLKRLHEHGHKSL